MKMETLLRMFLKTAVLRVLEIPSVKWLCEKVSNIPKEELIVRIFLAMFKGGEDGSFCPHSLNPITYHLFNLCSSAVLTPNFGHCIHFLTTDKLGQYHDLVPALAWRDTSHCIKNINIFPIHWTGMLLYLQILNNNFK